MLPIHLWVYNHPFPRISDQVSFAVLAFRQHGYAVSVGRRPVPTSLNVVIEGFSSSHRDILIEFCRSFQKKVAVIMTEHMDFEHGRIFFHGSSLGSENDYLHPISAMARVTHLLECLPYIRCLFVLGDLPELRNMSIMLPGINIRSIPFPKLDDMSNMYVESSTGICSNLVFTGAITRYREKLLAILEADGIPVACPKVFVSRRRRNSMNHAAKLILNIPQREAWRWLSLMRIVAGLQMGRATISLGTSDVSCIASCCMQLDILKEGWINEVKKCIDDWRLMYRRSIVDYSLMAKVYEQKNPFPHDVFEYWSITDRVSN